MKCLKDFHKSSCQEYLLWGSAGCLWNLKGGAADITFEFFVQFFFSRIHLIIPLQITADIYLEIYSIINQQIFKKNPTIFAAIEFIHLIICVFLGFPFEEEKGNSGKSLGGILRVCKKYEKNTDRSHLRNILSNSLNDPREKKLNSSNYFLRFSCISLGENP